MSRLGLMFDAESLGTAPNAALLSVGIVIMDMDQLKVLHDRWGYGLIDPADCQKYGMTIDFDTVNWWMKQDQVAQGQVFGDHQRMSLSEAVKYVDWFVNGFHNAEVWSCGSRDFDWLETMFKAYGSPTPWNYGQVRDYRTMRELFGHLVETPDTTIRHHALEDARWQAEHLMRILRMLRECGRGELI